MLGLKGHPQDSEPEVAALDARERSTREVARRARRVAQRRDRPQREGAAKEADYKIPDEDRRWRPLAVCEREEALYHRVAPFAGLVREDTVGLPDRDPSGAACTSRRGATGARRARTTRPRRSPSPSCATRWNPSCTWAPPRGLPREQWKLRTARGAPRAAGVRHGDGQRRLPGAGVSLPRRAARRGVGAERASPARWWSRRRG